MATGSDIRSIMDLDPPQGGADHAPVAAPAHASAAREAPKSQVRRFKKSAIRSRGRPARWLSQASPAATTRSDQLQFTRWRRAPTTAPPTADGAAEPLADRFARYNAQPEIPTYDDEIYAKHLAHPEWSREETDYLLNVFKECNGKWPVIVDHYAWSSPDSSDEQQQQQQRTMEELKARFYTVSAGLLQLNTPITSMTAPEYSMFETLSNFDPMRETARKKLVEAHLKRHQSEVDEESVLLSELQRIMLNQANLDSEREELRRRLDYPHANTNGYQYSTSVALTTLWQQMVDADRIRKKQRLRATGNPAVDGTAVGQTPTSASSARPRDSLTDMNTLLRRAGGGRDSLASASGVPNSAGATAGPASASAASAPSNSLPAELSKADMQRFGVVQSQDKLPSGVTFASDKLSKPRIAKSTIQTEKIATILGYAQVPELIALPTPAVVEMFEGIMGKVHALLDLRKLKDKEEQEVKVREAEVSAAGAAQ